MPPAAAVIDKERSFDGTRLHTCRHDDGLADICIFFCWCNNQSGCDIVVFLTVIVPVLTESMHIHMQQYEVEYLQFAFRWMNNLLMRELPLRCTIDLASSH